MSSITWTATVGGIKPSEFDEFEVSAGPLPKAEQMVFKALQTYANGDVVCWIEPRVAGGAESARDRACDASTREVLEVMVMPRSVQEILDHADELAARFEDYEPAESDERDPKAYAALRDAVVSRSDSERAIKDAVERARAQGYSWAFIGKIIGTSGEAASQRYGHKQDV